MNNHLKCFALLCLFLGLTTHFVKAQTADEPATEKSEISNSADFSRWVISPVFTPGISVLSSQKDATGAKIPIEENSRFLLGLRLEKYFPNRAQGMGFEVDYLTHSVVFKPSDATYYLTENQVAFSAFYSLKKGGIFSTFHPNLEFGLRNEIAFRNTLTYALSNGTTDAEKINDVFRFYRLRGFVGLGWKKDAFNQAGSIFRIADTNNKRLKEGLSSFALRVYFPIFNQGNIFKDDGTGFPSPVGIFSKNKAFNLFLTLTYTQNIDFKENGFLKPYEAEIDLINDNSELFLPPLINKNISRKKLHGNFALQYEILSPNTDSIFLSANQDTTVFQNGRTFFDSGSYRFGYSLHFGNESNFFKERIVIDPHTKFLWDIFVNASIDFKRQKLATQRPARLYYDSFAFSGGIKVGLPPPSIYLTMGYSYLLPFRRELLIDNGSVDEVNYSGFNNQMVFVGLGIRNNLYVLFNYHFGMESLKVEQSFFDQVGITVGFGL